MIEQIFLAKFFGKKENYSNIETLTNAENAQISRILLYIRIISFFLSVYAAYLFYNCSAKLIPWKRVLGIIFAFSFGLFYLIYYFIRFLFGGKC